VAKNTNGEGRLGFLDAIGELFGHRTEPEAAERPDSPADLGGLDAQFSAAIRELDQKVEEFRKVDGPAAGTSRSAEADRAAQRKKRMQESHRAIREDIEKMHTQIGTGLSGADLDALIEPLQELEKLAAEGRDSHELLPRARFAIANRLLLESGELAVTRLLALLERAGVAWPDPDLNPKASPERVEASQRRRRASVREAFLRDGFERTGERMFGVVSAWGSDYPDRGSPLWQETVLEGVAAGIRARLVEDFVGALRADRQAILGLIEDSIGKQVNALQDVVRQGVSSLDQAHRAVASSLRVLDEVVPGIAWEHVRSKLPEARGEFAD